jgi:nucleoside-diphosphate-sugar epimerase
LIDTFSSIFNKEVKHQHVEPRPGEVFRNVLNYDRARSLIGWQPRTALEQGILKTFEHFKEISRS